MKNMILKGYQGLFFDQQTQEKLIDLQENGLHEIVKDMHVTFKFGKTEAYPEELMKKVFHLQLIGYASNGKNSGFRVKIPEELHLYYQNPNTPHITVSLGEIDGEKGRAIDTGTMEFKKLDKPVTIQGQLGYYIYGKGKVMDNHIFR